jgi:hypothetical protein
MVTTAGLLIVMVLIYLLDQKLNMLVVRNVFGLAFLIEMFYVIGSGLGGWPFPRPVSIVQIVAVVALGMALGVMFARIWPLPEETGFERIIRTFLLCVPSIGTGIGLQLLLQGPEARQALYLVFALSAWIGSGQGGTKSAGENGKNETAHAPS